MSTVVLATTEVANNPHVGGHFWVFMQYAYGFQQAGYTVYWLEGYREQDEKRDLENITIFSERLARFGLDDRFFIYRKGAARPEFINIGTKDALATLGSSDLLVNFTYELDEEMLGIFPRSALIDIDPGLLQLWMSSGQLSVAPHDLYFTTGETVGTSQARFPDAGIDWTRITPPVALELWPLAATGGPGPFTTVSSWWGDEWINIDHELVDNNKRKAFLPYRALPQASGASLELALAFGDEDAEDLKAFSDEGWRIRHSFEVAGSPTAYQRYIQESRGEFSCAKASCVLLQNGWVSDRTLCYMASGKPVVVQHTGPSRRVPDDEGIFRFHSMEEATASIAEINSDYERHSRAAREITEAGFDARTVANQILAAGLG